MEEFVVGPYETALAEDEVIEAVLVPLPREDVAATYAKFQVLERPAVGVAAAAPVANGVFAGAPTLVLGAVDERPLRVDASPLGGATRDDVEAFVQVANAAREAVDPVGDLSGSAEYKRHLTGVLVQRALRSLLIGGDA